MFERFFKKNHNPLITLSDPYSPISEQFKVLRTKLFLSKNGNRPRTILVTSAIQGEGKTTISSNLAISIAQGLHEHVLLVDCDLRCPAVHKVFDVDISKSYKGICNYLKNDEDVSGLLIKTQIDKLTILPAGRGTLEPAELISSQKMVDLFDELKSRYDDRYIVIDSTPIISASESIVLANLVDCIVFVIRSNKTTKESVGKAIRHIGKEKIIGIVFNNTKKKLIKKYEYYKPDPLV